jgi:hypothetical protein
MVSQESRGPTIVFYEFAYSKFTDDLELESRRGETCAVGTNEIDEVS